MYSITGITGKVGGEVARTLLNAAQPVRAVLRDAGKGAAWEKRSCAVSLAHMNDATALTAAFQGATGVFVLLPPVFDPAPGFPETRATVDALRHALHAANPQKVVCISTIGAQASQTNLLTQLRIMEESFGDLPMPVAFVRPAWFMENYAWDVASARDTGIISSFLQPLDRAFPMVATADVGRVAAELLQETWTGMRVLELEGPNRVSPVDAAMTFAKIFDRPVRAQVVDRNTWETLFKSQGMKHPTPRIQMLDGFNKGWIRFEQGAASRLKGRVELREVLHGLADRHE
jgi:uncharacterized protein YbjT (DUF2867 family)